MSADINRKKLAYVAVVVVVFAILGLSYYANRPKESVTYSRMQMGTVVDITLFDTDAFDAERATEAAFLEVERLERLLSNYLPDSDVGCIAMNAGKGPVKVSPETIRVLEIALEAAHLTDGAFDPTIGALSRLWGWSGEKGKVPGKNEIERALRLVGYKGVLLDKERSLAGLDKDGMTLNLGGVAKGYIVGSAVEELKKNGATRGIIKAGGDMFVFNAKEGEPFKIGIRNPRKEGALLGTALAKNGAVSTSGDYERYFEVDGVRYHHILDPRTGYPATHASSVTIVSEDPTLADALSTGVFVLGPQKGMALIERLANVEGVIVDAQGKVMRSSGFIGTIEK